jgi:branched-chain amino acid transport system permease protein
VFIASLIGCFGGAYLIHLYGWVRNSQFSLEFSILPIAATVMGGMGTLVGPVIGALILTPLSEALRGFGQLRVVLYCLILIGFIVYKPEGLMNYLQRKYHQFEHWEDV